MGGLPPLIAFVAFATFASAIAACNPSNTAPEAGARAQAVPAKNDVPSAAAIATSAPSHAQVVQPPPRKLCEKDLDQPGRRLPKATFTPVAAPGAALPSDRIATGTGRWTWINFFAAWCGPCKEEMPRLRAFQEKLAANLDVTFVSLDDDERQLRQLLTTTTDAGPVVRSALWLEPNKTRSTWLTALKMKESPDLPAHVLVDPSGKVRCVIDGAVVDTDFPTIAAIVAR